MKLGSIVIIENSVDGDYIRIRNAIIHGHFAAIAPPCEDFIHYYSVLDGTEVLKDVKRNINDVEKCLNFLPQYYAPIDKDISYLEYCKNKFKELPQNKVDWFIPNKEKEEFYNSIK